MHTKLKSYALLAAVALLFSTCEDDAVPAPARLTATRNGQTWEPDVTGVKATWTNGQIRLSTGFCGMDLLFDGQTTGLYLTGRDQFNAALSQDQTCGEVFFSNLEALSTGLLEITDIDRTRKTISGQFTFDATSRSGGLMRVSDGIFASIPYTEEMSNADNKPVRGWIEEDGRRYAFFGPSFTGSQFYGTTASQKKILTLIFPGTSFVSGTYDLTPNGTPDGNIHLVYNVIHNSVDVSIYEPAPGSQVTFTLLPGSVTSFTANLDVVLLKQGGIGVNSLHLKSDVEVHQ